MLQLAEMWNKFMVAKNGREGKRCPDTVWHQFKTSVYTTGPDRVAPRPGQWAEGASVLFSFFKPYSLVNLTYS